MTKKIIKYSLVIFVNVAAIEVIGAIFGYTAFNLTYSNPEKTTEEFTIKDPTETLNGPRQLHPYFGFTYKNSLHYINKQGFQNKVDFPYVKKPGEFVVGAFGGVCRADSICGL